MKTLLPFVLLVCMSLSAQAQKSISHEKVASFEMDVVLLPGTTDVPTFTEVKESKEDSYARLYKFKNARIKKALSFTTAKDRPKLT